MKTSNKFSTRELALVAIFSAIIIFQTWFPMLGYIKFGIVDFTIIHITVILGACLLGPKLGAVIGLTWGLTSMIYAFQTPGLLNPVFYNPLVSVVPRILVGFIAGLLFVIFRKFTKTALASTVAAVAGTITNTTLVLTGFYFFGFDLIVKNASILAPNYSGDNSGLVFTFVTSLISTNTLLELVAAVLVVSAIVVPLEKVFAKKQ